MAELVFILALLGFLDALYFTFAYYGRVRKLKWVPEVLCAREDSSCVTVVKTPYGRIFGVPNSLLGIAYYLLVMKWAADAFASGVFPVGYDLSFGSGHLPLHIGWILIAASLLTLVLGFYLVWALRAKLHVHCLFCYAAHAINAVLFVLVLVIFR